MMSTFVRIGVAVTSGAVVIGLALLYLPATGPAGNASLRQWMGVTLLISSVAFGAITWQLQQFFDLKDEYTAFRKHVSARLRMNDLFEDDSPALHAMLHREET